MVADCVPNRMLSESYSSTYGLHRREEMMRDMGKRQNCDRDCSLPSTILYSSSTPFLLTERREGEVG